ncbi:uncharacterized protein [Montipora capricornis]|uniref:uncharacterized protein n=1 Tax=Montipora capricornis TaxID=246305 RepID=UPI0035F18509
MAYLGYQIRKLPYGILKSLSDQLNIPGPRDWKSLISVMPSDTYTTMQVGVFQMEAMRLGGSPAMSLLVDLGQQCKTVKQLVVWLKKIGNDDALEILDYTGQKKECNFLLATTNTMSPHCKLSVTQSTYLIQYGNQDVGVKLYRRQ